MTLTGLSQSSDHSDCLNSCTRRLCYRSSRLCACLTGLIGSRERGTHQESRVRMHTQLVTRGGSRKLRVARWNVRGFWFLWLLLWLLPFLSLCVNSEASRARLSHERPHNLAFDNECSHAVSCRPCETLILDPPVHSQSWNYKGPRSRWWPCVGTTNLNANKVRQFNTAWAQCSGVGPCFSYLDTLPWQARQGVSYACSDTTAAAGNQWKLSAALGADGPHRTSCLSPCKVVTMDPFPKPTSNVGLGLHESRELTGLCSQGAKPAAWSDELASDTDWTSPQVSEGLCFAPGLSALPLCERALGRKECRRLLRHGMDMEIGRLITSSIIPPTLPTTPLPDRQRASLLDPRDDGAMAVTTPTGVGMAKDEVDNKSSLRTGGQQHRQSDAHSTTSEAVSTVQQLDAGDRRTSSGSEDEQSSRTQPMDDKSTTGRQHASGGLQPNITTRHDMANKEWIQRMDDAEWQGLCDLRSTASKRSQRVPEVLTPTGTTGGSPGSATNRSVEQPGPQPHWNVARMIDVSISGTKNQTTAPAPAPAPPVPAVPLPPVTAVGPSGSAPSGAPSSAPSQSGPVYLFVPFSQISEARQLGARFDRYRRKWYAAMGEPHLVERWGTPIPAQDRTYLDVPFNDNGRARELGALWDRRANCWYDPSPERRLLQHWPTASVAIKLPVQQWRTYLRVPFKDKDEAKVHGARWDSRKRLWYCPATATPDGRAYLCSRWPAVEAPGSTPGSPTSSSSGSRTRLMQRVLELDPPRLKNAKTNQPLPVIGHHREHHTTSHPPAAPPDRREVFAVRGGTRPGVYYNFHEARGAAIDGDGQLAVFNNELEARGWCHATEYVIKGGRRPGIYHDWETALRVESEYGGELFYSHTPPDGSGERHETQCNIPATPATPGQPPAGRPFKPVYAVCGGGRPGVYHRLEEVGLALKTGGRADMFENVQDAINYCLGREMMGPGGGGVDETPGQSDTGREPHHDAKDAADPGWGSGSAAPRPYHSAMGVNSPGGGSGVREVRHPPGRMHTGAMRNNAEFGHALPGEGREEARPNPDMQPAQSASARHAHCVSSGIAMTMYSGPQSARKKPVEQHLSSSVTRSMPPRTPQVVTRGHPRLPMMGAFEQPPSCVVLSSTDRREIASWRLHLASFEESLTEYNNRNGLAYDPPLKQFVNPDTWAIISEQLLAPHDLTEVGALPNNRAVERYLRGTGVYASMHGRPGELYCADPLAQYRNLRWPDTSQLSYTKAFDVYMSQWRAFTVSLPEVDRPEDIELVQIMLAAVRPEWLQRTIRRKITSGKGPELVGPTTPWRKQAKENLLTLIVVIRENMDRAELLRGTLDLQRWIAPEATMQTQPRPRQSARATPAPQHGAYPAVAAAGGGTSTVGLQTLSTPPQAHSQAMAAASQPTPPPPPTFSSPAPAGAVQTTGGDAVGGGVRSDPTTWPACPVAGCTERCRPRRDGGYFNTCFRHAGSTPAVDKSGWPTCPVNGCTEKCRPRRDGGHFQTCWKHSEQNRPKPAGVTEACILAGCERPRKASPLGRNYLACCREHFLLHKANTLAGNTQPAAKRPAQPTPTRPAAAQPAAAQPATSQPSPGVGGGNPSTASAPAIASMPTMRCFMCGGNHPVSLCDKLNAERRRELTTHLAFDGSTLWWSNRDNRDRAQQYATAHQWATMARPAPPGANDLADSLCCHPCPMPEPRVAYHGTVQLLNQERHIYFDLGGDYNLADEPLYDAAVSLAGEEGNGVALVTLAELGYTERGIPIDMAGGASGGSSLVWVTKWARLVLDIHTALGRRLRLNHQLVGFVQRSTPLVLLGQNACGLCGYRTIEQQDCDRNHEYDENLTSEGAGTVDAEDVQEHEHEAHAASRSHHERVTRPAAPVQLTPELVQMIDAVADPVADHNPAGEDPIDEGRRSPDTIADVAGIDYMDLPGLVDWSEESSSDFETDSDIGSDDDIPGLLDGTEAHYGAAHMQRLAPLPRSGIVRDTTAPHPDDTSITTTPAPRAGVSATYVETAAPVIHYIGDLLNSTADLIVHQTNCTSTTAGGLAALIFARFPHSDCYTTRGYSEWPGTIMVCGDGRRSRRVVNLHGQYNPGAPRRSGMDTRERRVLYFRQALRCLADYIRCARVGVRSVAFPANIGCGLAEGHWAVYSGMITDFAQMVNASTHRVQVSICHLPDSDGTARAVGVPPDLAGPGTGEPDDVRDSPGPSDAASPAADRAEDVPPDRDTDSTGDADVGGPVDKVETTEPVIDMTGDNSDTPSGDDNACLIGPRTKPTDDGTLSGDNTSADLRAPTSRQGVASRAGLHRYIAPLIDLTLRTDEHTLKENAPAAATKVPAQHGRVREEAETAAGPTLMQEVRFAGQSGPRLRALKTPAEPDDDECAVPRPGRPARRRPQARARRQKGPTVASLMEKAPIQTEVRLSTILGAGRGLFSMQHVQPGEVVARYSGDVLTKQQCETSKSAYLLEINSNCFLDAQDPSNFEGRFINDGPHSGRVQNCEFAAAYTTNPLDGSTRRWIKVYATREILPGEELLASYGPGYWDSHARPPGAVGRQYSQTTPSATVSTDGKDAIRPMSHDMLDVMDAVNRQLPDGIAYLGAAAHEHVLSCDFFFSEDCSETYITTAALRRSGCHPADPTSPLRTSTEHETTHSMRDLNPCMRAWMTEGGDPTSTLHQACRIELDKVVVLLPQTKMFHLRGVPVKVVPGNLMRCVIGTDLRSKLQLAAESDESPLQHKTMERCEEEVAAALDRLVAKVNARRDLRDGMKTQVGHLLRVSCARLWRAKFDLQQACYLPEMRIELQPGATPTRIKRRYRWSDEQDAFLEQHLADLVNAGVISHIETEWLCPIVLVEKADDTWRLCVDPSTLNSVTIPMTWQMPEVRRLLQAKLVGCSWFAKFDFVAMFWQLGLHPESRKLFSFFAGRFGSFCFNRVAMGALNSSCYTQKMLARMFQNVTFRGKPVMENGLFVQTDDVLLYADTADTLLELMVLFLRTVMMHNLAIHPDKCVVFTREVIYCGLKVSGQGVSVDPERLEGLKTMPAPTTVGDVWRFKASVGWIRPEIPLLSVAEGILNEFVTVSLRPHKKRDMRAADKILLATAGWGRQHRDAWDIIKRALAETIVKSFRNRRWIACIFTDASETGWAICITQCPPGELDKPWGEQKHELLAVSSGLFRSSQKNWAMSCKEAFPLMVAVRKHRHLLLGDWPFASVNDHESLKHVFAGPLRTETVGKPAQGRLARWATFLRSFVFQVRHIPGAENMFCDLLSRNGCTTAVALHRQLHTGLAHSPEPPPASSIAAKQYAIIMPTGLPRAPAGGAKRSRDLNVADNRLLPAVGADTWPTPKAIADAQTAACLRSPTHIDVDGHYLLTDASNRVLLPAPQVGAGGLLDVIIVVAHQGDRYHRSSEDTVRQFKARFAIQGFSESAVAKHVTHRCRGCLSCIKLRTGGTIPRPLWFLVRATTPFEYVHMDFLAMPLAANGMQWILVVVDDLSLTTLLHPCKRCTAEEVVRALIDEWLAHYPDPVLLHTDGGRHFDNAVVRGIARECGWRHTISTAYAKWTHGVAESANRVVLDIFRPLLRSLRREVNQWPAATKLVQRALQRKRRKSRGDKSPLELTTSIVPRAGTDLLINEGLDVRRVDGDASQQLDQATGDLAALLESHWDLANTARRAKSEQNRAKTDMTAMPDIDLGDYVLYAVHVPDTKLDYRWRGPGQVIHQVTPMVFIVEPVGVPHVRPFPVHTQRLRRFATADLDVTEQLRIDVQRDHPANVIQKLVDHQVYNHQLWFRVRWLGFSAARDTWQLAAEINASAPNTILVYYRRRRTRRSAPLIAYMRTNFPSADEEARMLAPAAQPRAFRRRAKRRPQPLPTIDDPAPPQHVGPTEARPRGGTRGGRGGTRGRMRGGRGRTRGGRGQPRRSRGRPPGRRGRRHSMRARPAGRRGRAARRRGRARGGRTQPATASRGRDRGSRRASTSVAPALTATAATRTRARSADAARAIRTADVRSARLRTEAGRPRSSERRARLHVKVSNSGTPVTYDSWVAQQSRNRDERLRRRRLAREAESNALRHEHDRVTAELAEAAEATAVAARYVSSPIGRPTTRSTSGRGRRAPLPAGDRRPRTKRW